MDIQEGAAVRNREFSEIWVLRGALGVLEGWMVGGLDKCWIFGWVLND